MYAREWNFDGLVGPTHHFGGLGLGNVASAANAAQPSNPRAAALQGLAKMRRVLALGVPQAVLPPAPRPDPRVLRAIDPGATPRQILERLRHQDPQTLQTVMSAASMWAANAATVSPAADVASGRLQITPANLVANPHRASEAIHAAAVFARLFPDPERATRHAPLPSQTEWADEGAANHLRLAPAHSAPGLEIFVAGPPAGSTQRHRPRASAAVGPRLIAQHGVRHGLCLQQSPVAVDAGAFHNDVVAVSHRQLLVLHELAWSDTAAGLAEIRRLYLRHIAPEPPLFVAVSAARLSLEAAVGCYLFNSQILDTPAGGMHILAPRQCAEHPSARALLEEWVDDPALPISGWEPVDLDQSMRNGGGPACLRLRVVLSPEAEATLHRGVILTPELADRLEAWIRRHYRERLVWQDLADPALAQESWAALEALTQLLDLPGLYPFQRGE